MIIGPEYCIIDSLDIQALSCNNSIISVSFISTYSIMIP